MIKTALISVSDKTGIVEFAKILQNKGVKIISTGGTAKKLNENGIKSLDISDITDFPEMMNGRVKTLHPKIHGGLLALRENEEHQNIAKKHGIGMIDLVVVNLYPFVETIAKEGVSENEAIEQIDIGGPSMLRSAAKNFQSVTVITDTFDLKKIGEEIEKNGDTNFETRKNLAIKVFETTSMYDSAICDYLSKGEKKGFFFDKKQELRYGENPHQDAVFLKEKNNKGFNITNSKQIQGKELSYNNIMDADLAWSIVEEFDGECAVSIIKHATPCGVAIGKDIFEAYNKAYEVDKISPFGGIVAVNAEVDEKLAKKLSEIFLEIVIAPTFTKGALEVFSKKKNLRILKTGGIKKEFGQKMFKKVSGGLLVQGKNESGELKNLKTVTKKQATENQIKDSQLAWKIIKYVKSNSIVIVKDGVALGIGAGQTNRVRSSRLALKQAKDTGINLKGAVIASDAFFPFSDGVEVFDGTGIECIVQPGGSIRDEEVIASADKMEMAMLFCGERAFLH